MYELENEYFTKKQIKINKKVDNVIMKLESIGVSVRKKINRFCGTSWLVITSISTIVIIGTGVIVSAFLRGKKNDQ